MTLGAAGIVAGPWLGRHELTILGLGVYVVGAVGLVANIVGTYLAGDRRQSRRVGLVLGAYLWLVFPVPWAPLALLFPDTVPAGPIGIAAVTGLAFGWMLQLAMAFLPVVAVSTERATAAKTVATIASVAEDVSQPSWIQVGSVNIGMFARWVTAFPPIDPLAAARTLGGYALISMAWLLVAISFWRSPGDSGEREQGGVTWSTERHSG